MQFFHCIPSLARRFVSFLLPVALLAPLVRGQSTVCQPAWVPTFGSGPGVVGDIYSECEFDDGHGLALFVGGGFSNAGGEPCHGIAKWNGTQWSDIGGGIGGAVLPNTLPFASAMAVFDDGSGPALYVGGNFTTAGGVTAINIARWDGAHWSAVGSGLEASLGSNAPLVATLTVFDDGQGPALYAGGSFGSSSGTQLNGIAKWDGANWLPVGSGVPVGAGAAIICLEGLDLGTGPKLYAGGWFQSIGGVSAHGVAAWNGSTWSPLGSGVNGAATCFAMFDSGSGNALYVGGSFNGAGGITTYGLARWNGSAWAGVAGTLIGSWTVKDLKVFHDGSGSALYVTGSLFNPAGANTQGIVRWNGTQWSAVGGGINGYMVYGLLAHDDGSGPALFAVGSFSSAGWFWSNGAAKWNGTTWASLGGNPAAMRESITALAVHDDGHRRDIYAGITDTPSFGTTIHGIAHWNGTAWSSLGSGIDGAAPVSALASFDDGSGPALYAAGDFSAAGGVPASRIARWNGQSWSTLGQGIGALLADGETSDASALCVYNDGSGSALYVGGRFDSAGGAPAYAIARWNGSQWSPVGTGLGPPTTIWDVAAVRAFAVHDDGHGTALYAGGWFTTAGGAPANFIAKWDGSTWLPVGCLLTDAVSEILALASYDDGSGPALYAGGGFDSIGGVVLQSLARWDGTNWSAFGGGLSGSSSSPWVYSLQTFDEGNGPKLFVSSDFTQASGQNVNYITNWDGQSWSDMQGGLNAPALRMAEYDDGVHGPRLCIGGWFQDSPAGDMHVALWGCTQEPIQGFCFGDGSSSSQIACPCGNTGAAGRGCENSATTGGAQLVASGEAFNDTLVLSSSSEVGSALSIFLQGDAQNANGVVFGDGVRCVAGALKRLYTKSAVGGSASAPSAGDPTIRQRSANLGDPITPGTRRWYQVYYRDADANFCPAPLGSTWNVSNGLEVHW
ncbi:MAG: hypothetical protein IPJ19_15945 [Planctomycetes bacterium]|nr:hypothetical protein [Planctomycetota bacterium]